MKPISNIWQTLLNLPLSLKILASSGIILTLGIASSDWLLYQKAERMLMESAWQSMHQSLKQQSERITQYLDEARHDAIFLSHSHTAQEILKGLNRTNTEYLKNIQQLENQFSGLIEEKGYLQIRLIDLASGMELVRVNRPKNKDLTPIITKAKNLQNKKSSNYVKESTDLKRNQIYTSSINLNREHNKIVRPVQPTQRFIAGVFSVEENDTELTASEIADYIRHFDLELTTATIRAAQTGNLVWQEHYNFIARRLDLALNRARELTDNSAQDLINLISIANEALIKIEEEAFKLVSLGLGNKAEVLITSREYLEHKEKYKTPLNKLINKLEMLEDNRNNHAKAIVVINTNFQDILSSFRSIKTHETTLINKHGEFLYNHDIDKQFSFELNLNSTTFINEEPIVWRNLTNNIEEKLEFDKHDELHVSQKVYFDGERNGEFIGLVLTKSREDILAPALKLGFYTFIIALVSILSSLLLTLFIVKRQTKPITDLTKHAVRISNGDLNENLPTYEYSDEVGKLTNAFTNLIGKLQIKNRSYQHQSEQISKLNSNLELTISERTARLKEASIKAEEASTAKSNFLATMSHEIRTPLNGMLGMAQLLDHTELTPKQEEYVRIISHSGDSLLTIINDILDFSKIESGKLDLEPIVFDLNNLSNEVIDLMSSKAGEKELELELLYDSKLPNHFVGDQGRIRQVILNLLGNAIKFTLKGSIRLEVTLLNKNNHDYHIQVSVIDTGIGISKENQESLFDAFQQADSSTTRKFGGTGLGLAICKSFIELMKGEIGLKSLEGEGSEFWFRITIPEATIPNTNSSDLKHSSISKENEEIKTQLNGKVLLVEDNKINQVVAQDMLEESGLDVDLADNGNEAIQSWRQGKYDLILMDCLMPELDGFEATKHIRSLEKNTHIPIIALTANVSESDKKACIDAGMDDFLGKPIEMDLLFSVLKNWLHR